MRPDRIVVGEVRGAESLDMLQAMNTGHEGSISTVHANSPRDAVARMETLVLMAGMDLPLRAIREQIASAIDIIVQISRHKDGVRRITHITEVHGMEGDVVLCKTPSRSITRPASTPMVGLGRIEPTGVRPRFASESQITALCSRRRSSFPITARCSERSDEPVVLVIGLAICLLAVLVLVFFTVAPSPPRVARDRRVAPGTEHVSLLTRMTEQTTAVIQSTTSKRRARLFGAEELELAGVKSEPSQFIVLLASFASVSALLGVVLGLSNGPRSSGHRLRDPHATGCKGAPDRSNITAAGEIRRPDRRHRATRGGNAARGHGLSQPSPRWRQNPKRPWARNSLAR